jgi:hypothetical protein
MYWRNSNFQYIHFVFGACHTALEAHRKCCEALEDREMANAQERGVIPDNAIGKNLLNCYDQLQKELVFLADCKAKLESYIGHVPTQDEYQENQREEWKLEFKRRVENFLLSQGCIPPDQLSVMRNHPDFAEIKAHIDTTRQLMDENYNFVPLPAPWKKPLLLEDMK